jgi:hypothetical protein
MTENRFDWETGAHEALKKAGAIRPCQVHPDICVRTHDAEAERAAYAIGTNMLKRGDGDDRRWRQEFMSEIAGTLDQTHDTCFICDAAYERGD